MKSQRRATASARPSATTAAGPRPNARAVYQHVERFLAGALNEDALDGWRLAFARSGEIGQAMDAFLHDMAEMYIREYGLPGKGRHA